MSINFFDKKKDQIASHHYHNEAKLICDAKLEDENIKVSSTEEYDYSIREFITITKIELVDFPEHGERVVVFNGAKGRVPEIYRTQGSDRWEDYWSSVLVPSAKQKLQKKKQKDRDKKKSDKTNQKKDREKLWKHNHSPLP